MSSTTRRFCARPAVTSGVELHMDVRYQKSTQGERDGLRANFGFRMGF